MPVQTYVPSYPQKQWTITPRQLLSDVAGVHRPRGDSSDNLAYGHCSSLGDALKAFADEPLSFEPGTKYQFSTYGWVLLSAVVESASGEPFASFISREVFKPLGMDRTALEGTDNDADSVSFYFPRTMMRPSPGAAKRARRRLLVFFWGGRVPFYAFGSGARRLGHAEAGTPEGRNDSTVPDAIPAEVRNLHRIRIGLDGRHHPACRFVNADAASPCNSNRQHRLALVVPGSQAGDSGHDQRDPRHGCRPLCTSSRRGIRAMSAKGYIIWATRQG